MLSGQAEQRNQRAWTLLEPIQHRLMETRIRRTEAIERSQMHGEDRASAVVLERPSGNRGARDYRDLVREVERWATR